jgi:hypothetical protein
MKITWTGDETRQTAIVGDFRLQAEEACPGGARYKIHLPLIGNVVVYHDIQNIEIAKSFAELDLRQIIASAARAQKSGPDCLTTSL